MFQSIIKKSFFLITLVCIHLIAILYPRPSEAATYVVKKGDTLWGIATKFKTSVKRLQEINHIKGTLIHPGDIIQIPEHYHQPLDTKNNSSPHPAGTSPARGNTQDIIDTAMRFLGYPYRYGGATPQSGFDCSGFVQYVFSLNGIKLPRTASQQAGIGTKVMNPIAGDLVFFDTDHSGSIGHVGIYIGNNAFIHASRSKGVTITSLSDDWYSQRYTYTCRVIKDR
ncbi:MAG: NlpC/P60 family protein [Thermacetogeniaceae bacterium]